MKLASVIYHYCTFILFCFSAFPSLAVRAHPAPLSPRPILPPLQLQTGRRRKTVASILPLGLGILDRCRHPRHERRIPLLSRHDALPEVGRARIRLHCRNVRRGFHRHRNLCWNRVLLLDACRGVAPGVEFWGSRLVAEIRRVLLVIINNNVETVVTCDYASYKYSDGWNWWGAAIIN